MPVLAQGHKHTSAESNLITARYSPLQAAVFPNPIFGEGLLDRLLNSAYVVKMLGQSYRPTS